ncbi:MAG: hypothetical protein J6328_04485, partial [Bacilli bacterium]|nr:hypothetical protein [Bacilli bacterium]
MEKQKILDQVEEENARKIIMKIDAEKKGAIVACSVGIVALLIWNIVEYVVFSFVDWGGNIAFFAML